MESMRLGNEKKESFKQKNSEKGQALVEFALVLPIQLLFILAIMQFSLMYIAKQMTEYAAFCAARAALVHEETGMRDVMAKQAARLALAPIHPRGSGDYTSINSRLYEVMPGDNKLTVDLSHSDEKNIIAIVKYDYQMFIPGVNWLIAAPSKPSFYFYRDTSSAGPDSPATQRHGYPHINVQGLCLLPKPWKK
ncbi:MAG: pilus assembly protein [Planctomycetota bacterium]|nr:MAG: pilus assembly protein [Planctomycetota bacterium]